MSALPRIGISANFFYPDKQRLAYPPKTLQYWEDSLIRWVERGGAEPVLIPNNVSEKTRKSIMSGIDGIVFSGGADLSPKSYGEEPLKPEWAGDYQRDLYERELFDIAMTQKTPILGICRGHQFINVALGGSLYQDIQTQNSNAHSHRDQDLYDQVEHEVEILEGSVLATIYGGAGCFRINSIHHQSIKELGNGLSVQAKSQEDDIIEAIWLDDRDKNYVLGIQWHPEWISKASLLSPDKIRAHFLANL